jgi:MFS family permease
MNAPLQESRRNYPTQFWVMITGMLLSASGSSMIWPFLLIYVSGKLHLSLATIATLTSINAVTSVFSSFVAGPIADKIGRKGVMVSSLLGDGVIFILMIRADSYAAFAILMALRGLSNPLYRVGADAMLADLIPAAQRVHAYGLMRMAFNAGVSIGPAIGGFLAAKSYSLAFCAAAAGSTLYGLLLLLFARETLTKKTTRDAAPPERFGGYGRVLSDSNFVPVVGLIMIGWVTATLMWVILPVYAHTNYQIPEDRYGFIPATNALMVVLLQLGITAFTRRFNPLIMMTLGMLLYAVSNGIVGLGTGFWGFWTAMVVMTFGELVIVPTSSTFVANIAPADMRGRYMSIYGLTWSFGQGVGPVLGGLLNDHFGPHAIWWGGVVVGLISATGLFATARLARTKRW